MFTTADLWDEHETLLSCAEPIFNHYGDKKVFSGKISTLKLFEDNSLARKQLEADGGGSLRCVLIGDQLAALAIQNSWEGIIVNGCIRDSQVINSMNIGIKALNTCPVKSVKLNQGETAIPVKFGGITFTSDDYIYADADGILVSKLNLLK